MNSCRSAIRSCRLIGCVALLLMAGALATERPPPLGVPSLAARSPHLEKQGTATRLIVKGRPMLVLGGELGNSSASSATYMAAHWLRLKQLHLNTILTPVSWELIEPTKRSTAPGSAALAAAAYPLAWCFILFFRYAVVPVVSHHRRLQAGDHSDSCCLAATSFFSSGRAVRASAGLSKTSYRAPLAASIGHVPLEISGVMD